MPVRVVLAGLLPAAFGFLCGALLGSSGTVFLLLQIIGVLGGFAAGFEHDHWRGGVLWGLCGGALFGGFILIGHAVAGGSDHGLLPEVQAFQILITVFFGVLLGYLGARTAPAASASTDIRKFRREPAGVSPPLAVSSARRWRCYLLRLRPCQSRRSARRIPHRTYGHLH